MTLMHRRSLLRFAALGVLVPIAARFVPPAQAATPALEVYKSPWCGCCGGWVDHMRSAGFEVQVTEIENLDPIKARYGVTDDLLSCHTAVIDGYVIEGHVPAHDVLRLLDERPRAIGLSVPGMPTGAPGMEQGGQQDRFDVVLFSVSDRSVFASY